MIANLQSQTNFTVTPHNANLRKAIELFTLIHGQNPADLASRLMTEELSLADYSRECGVSANTLRKQFVRFGLTPYKRPKMESRTYVCKQCHETFDAPSRPPRSFCSDDCGRTYGNAAYSRKASERFVQTHGKNPAELVTYLTENKITLTDYARECGVRISALRKQFRRAGLTTYKEPVKEASTFTCQHCNKDFQAETRPSKPSRDYCDEACKKAGQKRPLDPLTFRITAHTFAAPLASLGNYDELDLGKRQRSFVNRDKVDHFYFSKGIHDEQTAYIFGVLLTDGSVMRNAARYVVRLEMKDFDIVEQTEVVLQSKYSQSITYDRRVLSITSPYLFNDLRALGCGPKKTPIANYPLVAPELDRHLIRGIIDGDGCWTLNKDRLQLFICGNDLLMYGIYLRIRDHLSADPSYVGYPADRDRRHKMLSFCQMSYNTSDSRLIRDWVYSGATILGARKFNRAHEGNILKDERITTARLAASLDVGEQVVRDAIKKYSDLPRRRVGQSYYYFEPEDVPAWKSFLKRKLRSSMCHLPNRAELRKELNVS